MSRTSIFMLSLLFVAAGCADSDGDGYRSKDCNDNNIDVRPGQVERCNGIDDDCDGEIDEDPVDARWVFADLDGDGFGDGQGVLQCHLEEGFVANGLDCDDQSPEINPWAPELCNGIDDNCDGLLDNDPIDPPFEDADGDGFGDPGHPHQQCDAFGVHNSDDCDDTNPDVRPGGEELCDGLDTDCDGLDDSEDPDAEPITYYLDQDMDGVGDGSPLLTCQPPANYAPIDGDCDDNNDLRAPGKAEVCDGVDNDCDGDVDGPNSWWDERWTARVPIKIQAPAHRAPGMAFAFDLDLTELLSEGILYEGARVLPMGCDNGREIPALLQDSRSKMSEAGGGGALLNDGMASVLLLWDTDGDPRTLEMVDASTELEYAIYFQGNLGYNWPTDLVVGPSSLTSGEYLLQFQTNLGGMPHFSDLITGEMLYDVGAAQAGNGVRTPSGGLSAQNGVNGIDLLDDERLTIAGLMQGDRANADGSIHVKSVYRMFAGRPELWLKTSMETLLATELFSESDQTSVIRPFQTLLPVDAPCETDGETYVQWETNTNTFIAQWLAPPSYVTHAQCDGPDAWLAGNDLLDCCSASSSVISAGEMLVDAPVIVISRVIEDATEERLARAQGVTVSVEPMQRITPP